MRCNITKIYNGHVLVRRTHVTRKFEDNDGPWPKRSDLVVPRRKKRSHGQVRAPGTSVRTSAVEDVVRLGKILPVLVVMQDVCATTVLEELRQVRRGVWKPTIDHGRRAVDVLEHAIF